MFLRFCFPVAFALATVLALFYVTSGLTNISPESVSAYVGMSVTQFHMLGLIIGMVALPTFLVQSREEEQQQRRLFSGFDRIVAITIMVVGTLMALEPLQDMPYAWWPALNVILALVVANGGKKLSYVAALLYICSMGTLFFFV